MTTATPLLRTNQLHKLSGREVASLATPNPYKLAPGPTIQDGAQNVKQAAHAEHMKPVKQNKRAPS